MTIYAPKGSRKTWMYEFQYQRKRYWKAGFKTKAEARAAEAERLKELKQKTVPTHTAMDFKTASYQYLDFIKRKYSDKSYKGKRYILSQFFAKVGNLSLDAIDDLVVLDYLSKRQSNTNFNRHRKHLCSFLSWAFTHRLMRINPCFLVEKMSEDRKRKVIPSQEEAIRMILASGEFRPFFICLFGLAARLGEVNNLKWEDVNFKKRIVTLWTKKGKTGEWRPQRKGMNDEVYAELHRIYTKYSRESDYVFPNPDTGLPYRNRRKQIRNACAAAGIPYYGWHSLRHLSLSILADSGKVGLQTIQKMAGHLRVSTTDRYIQSLGRDEREAADLLQILRSPENESRKSDEQEG